MRRTELARLRKARGLSQERLAAVLQVHATTVKKWEAGLSTPQPWLRPHLAAALSVTLSRLDSLLRTCEPPTRDSVQNANNGDAELLALQIAELRRDYRQVPSHFLLYRGSRIGAQIEVLLDQVRDTLTRRRFMAMRASAAILMSQIIWDSSQRRDVGAANRLLVTAKESAIAAGDSQTYSFALLRSSILATHGERRPAVGRGLAEQAMVAARSISQSLAGLAALHAMEACALMRLQAPYAELRSQAEQYLSRAHCDEPGFELLSHSQWGRLTGAAELHLGHQHAARRMLSESRLAAGSLKSRAIVYSNLAIACTRTGQLDEAVNAVHRAIDIAAAMGGGGALAAVVTAERELRPWQSVLMVNEVRDRIIDVIAGQRN